MSTSSSDRDAEKADGMTRPWNGADINAAHTEGWFLAYTEIAPSIYSDVKFQNAATAHRHVMNEAERGNELCQRALILLAMNRLTS